MASIKGKNFDRIILIIVLSLICLSTGFRVYMALSNGHALNDRVHYLELADNLYKGRGFVVEWINFPAFHWGSLVHPDPYKYPLYPVTVGVGYYIFGKSDLKIANVMAAIFASLSTVVAFLIGSKLYNRLVGLIAIIIILSNYGYWLYSINALATPLYGFLLTLSFYILIFVLDNPTRNSHWAVLGLFMGLAWLTRPEGIVIPISYVAIIYVSNVLNKATKNRENMYKGVLISILITILIMSPFFIRNLSIFGTPFHGASKLFVYAYSTESQKYESIFSIAPPNATEYWAKHSLSNFLTVKIINMVNLIGSLFLFLSPALAIFFIVGLAESFKDNSPLYLFLIYIFVYMFAYVVHLQMETLGSSLHLSASLPLISILVSLGIYRAFEHFLNLNNKKRGMLISFFILILLLSPLSSFNTISSYRAMTRDDSTEASQTINFMLTSVVDRLVEFRRQGQGNDEGVPRVKAARWLEENTLSSDVIMSRKVDIHYYSGHRKVVMIPFGPVSDIEYMVERYNVTYIMVLPNTFLLRPSLKDYVENKDLQEVYNEEGVRILKVMP